MDGSGAVSVILHEAVVERWRVEGGRRKVEGGESSVVEILESYHCAILIK